MRPFATLCGLALLSAGTHAFGADVPRTITVPEVEVRSGPGTSFYPTSKLRQGDTVQVAKEENGWLAIEPPPGSFSWINTLFLSQLPTTPGFVRVKGAKVPVRVGSSISNDEPTTQRVTLDPGTIVKVLDVHGKATNDGNWLPIEPPVQEFRYIPADAVKPQPQAQTALSSPGASATGFTPPAAAAHSAADAQMLTQAEAAERRGHVEEARRLYQQLAHLTKDHDLSVRCVNKDHWLEQGHRGSVPPGYQPGTPSTNTHPPQYNFGSRPAAPPGYPAGNSGVPAVTSQYTYYKESTGRPQVPVAVASRTNQAPPAGGATQGSGPGYLRRTTFNVDNKRAFALESSSRELVLYATALPGVNLNDYLGRRVELFGSMSYRGDVHHKNYMVVSQVREMP